MAEQLTVEAGLESFGPGRTRVEVHATGQVRIGNRFLGSERAVETSVAPAVAAQLMQHARAVRPDAQRAPWRPVPDEVYYQIGVQDAGTPVVTAQFWYGELRADPEATALITALQALVREATNGRIML